MNAVIKETKGMKRREEEKAIKFHEIFSFIPQLPPLFFKPFDSLPAL